MYNHCIDLNMDERVTILHGPNGVGKTVLLGMINGLLSGRFVYLGDVPFKRFSIIFENTKEIELITAKDAEGNAQTAPPHFKLSLKERPGKDVENIIVIERDLTPLFQEFTDRLPWLVRINKDAWFDGKRGDELSADQVLARYEGIGFHWKHLIGEEPSWFSRAVGRNSVPAYSAGCGPPPCGGIRRSTGYSALRGLLSTQQGKHTRAAHPMTLK